jgi:c(7)-type cytochrome triheme protein
MPHHDACRSIYLNRVLAALILTTASFNLYSQSCKIPDTETVDRFSPQTDGTVIDNKTGLMWMRCVLGQNWDGKQCQQPKPWFTYHTWDKAMQSASKSHFAGYPDWHLPSVDEMRTIVDKRCKDPAINPVIFPGSISTSHWTRQTYAKNDNYAWGIHFKDGKETADLKDNATYLVRLVRGSYVAPPTSNIQIQPKPVPPVAMSTEELKKLRRQRSRLWQDDIHDKEGPGMVLLQNPAEYMAEYPRNSWGRVDWMEALTSGHINPKGSITGDIPMQVIDLDIVMKNTGDMDYVRFPHDSHTQWLSCKNCHPNPFPYRSNLVEFNMNDVLVGKYCGICHGKVSFSPMLCDRCHNEKKDSQ